MTRGVVGLLLATLLAACSDTAAPGPIAATGLTIVSRPRPPRLEQEFSGGRLETVGGL